MNTKKKGQDPTTRPVAENRKARFNYEILDTFEAGIQLFGTEVKSLRQGRSNIADAYAAEHGGELYLYNAYIPEYLQANRFNHETRRPRKLLMHKKEIARLAGSVDKEGMTLVPLRVYFNKRGIAKVLIGLARGKKTHDKRETEKERSWNREKARLLREKG
ncbi:SsrA-binding protein SmpB [Amorphus sp. 3PC139-8]|uniref:SsrA-binding protein SmpB n=1 Tax=Amorphus sp. 3PC139-8 TaxID=2735676 RepID=UPI00345D4671